MTHSILLVDDSPHIRRILRYHFEKYPEWQICGEAENGEIAVEQVKELRPDIVILDFQMPIMNGLDAAKKISCLAPGTVLLMLTMHYSEELVKKAQAAGIAEVLSKSSNLVSELFPLLRGLCQLHPEI